MKQIALQTSSRLSRFEVCAGRLFAAWGSYGLIAALLWRLAGDDPLAQGAVWLVCGVTALGLLLAGET